MLVLAAVNGQLDYWGRLLEDLATAVEDKMVMGGNFRECEPQRRFEALWKEH